MLFMPRLPDSFAVWFGHITTPQEVAAKYAVDAVSYVDEMPTVLKQSGSILHVLHGENTDSERPVIGASFDGIDDFEVEREALFDVVTNARVVRIVLGSSGDVLFCCCVPSSLFTQARFPLGSSRQPVAGSNSCSTSQRRSWR